MVDKHNPNAVNLKDSAKAHGIPEKEYLRKALSLDHNSALPRGVTKGKPIHIPADTDTNRIANA